MHKTSFVTVLAALAVADAASAQQLLARYYKLPNEAPEFQRHVDVQRGVDFVRITGLVEPTLGPTGLPVRSAFGASYAGPSGAIQDVIVGNEVGWWRAGDRGPDRRVLADGVGVDAGYADGPGVYTYERYNLFPSGESGNQNFFAAVHWSGVFNATEADIAGAFMSVLSDDDAFIFVNGQLVVDNGGVKPFGIAPAALNVAPIVVGLNSIEIFFVDRQRTESNFRMQTNFLIVPAPGALALMGLGALVAGRRRR